MKKVWSFAIGLLMLAAPAAAQSTLSGTVYGNGTPLANTLIEALTDGTTTVVGSATSAANGGYAITLPHATYDLRVTPAQGSGFGAETIQNVVLAADRTYDVLLVSAATSITVSGTVTGAGGAAVPNANVYVYAGSNNQFIGQVQTNAAGAYSVFGNIQIAPSVVAIRVQGCCNGAVAPSSYFTYWQTNIPVAGSQATVDVPLPVAVVSGQVQRENGNAVPGATISSYAYQSNGNGFIEASSSTIADASGHYALTTFSGQNSFQVQPPSGAQGVLPLSVSVPIAGDTTRDLVLPSAVSFTAMGTVTGAGGAPVPNANLYVYAGSNQQFLGQVQTDSAGKYNVTGNVAALPSVVAIRAQGCCNGAVAPSSYFTYWQTNIPVSGVIATVDVALPVATVSGQVQRTSGVAVPGASISSYAYQSNGNGFMEASSSVVSDPAGNYSLTVFTGTNQFQVQPPSSAQGVLPLSTTVQVPGNTTQNLVLPSAVTFDVSGTVTGAGGAGVPNANIYIYTGSSNQFLGQVQPTAPASTP